MRQSLFILLLVLISKFSFAQSSIKQDSLITDIGVVGIKMLNHYKPNKDSLLSTCSEIGVFVKFNINSQGKISNLAFTRSTPPFISDALKNAFKELNAKYRLAHPQDFRGKTYIQPLQIIADEGCGNQYGSYHNAEANQLTDEMKSIYRMRQARYNQSAKSIFNITNFSDGSYVAINCILLSPLSTGGAMF